MHREEPTLTTEDLARIETPTLVMVADNDEVHIAHTLALFDNLVDAQLAVVPGCGHGLLAEKPDLCNTMIIEFLTNVDDAH